MNNTIKSRVTAVAYGAICAGAVLFASGQPAAAEGAIAKYELVPPTVYRSFDWHANGRSALERTVIRINQQQQRPRGWELASNGRGAYICSISGAGQRSRCFSR